MQSHQTCSKYDIIDDIHGAWLGGPSLMFSGRRRRGDLQFFMDILAAKQDQYILHVVSMDVVVSKEWKDATNPKTCEFWLNAIRQRHVIAFLGGPPCESKGRWPTSTWCSMWWLLCFDIAPSSESTDGFPSSTVCEVCSRAFGIKPSPRLSWRLIYRACCFIWNASGQDPYRIANLCRNWPHRNWGLANNCPQKLSMHRLYAVVWWKLLTLHRLLLWCQSLVRTFWSDVGTW